MYICVGIVNQSTRLELYALVNQPAGPILQLRHASVNSKSSGANLYAAEDVCILLKPVQCRSCMQGNHRQASSGPFAMQRQPCAPFKV